MASFSVNSEQVLESDLAGNILKHQYRASGNPIYEIKCKIND